MMIVEINKNNYDKFFKEKLYQFAEVDQDRVSKFFKEKNKLFIVVLDKVTIVITEVGEDFNVLNSFDTTPSIDYLQVLKSFKI